LGDRWGEPPFSTASSRDEGLERRVGLCEAIDCEVGVFRGEDMRRVLIVDDNAALAENIAEVLELDGHETKVATTAIEGLSKATSWTHDVLITDYRLPDISGAELVRRVKGLGLLVHAVVISAYTDDSTMEDARSAGAAFFPKPVDFKALGRIVQA
jgi:CheY-like chemotaxis protein